MAEEVLIPGLRFPEFEGVWEKDQLRNLVTFKSGGTPSVENEDYWGGDIPWISAASMEGKYYKKSERTLTEAGLKAGSRISQEGSMLLLVRGSMLYNKVPIGLVNKPVAFNQDLKSLIPSSKICREFLYEWFMFSQHRLLGLVVGTGIGAGKLDMDDLSRLEIPLPSIPEQQKIASFLTSVDKRIQLLQEKKAQLERYKKGVMQKLFSQEIRFKDENGNDFPEWEEKRLGELTVKTGRKNKENLQLPVYSINNQVGFLPQGDQFDGMDSTARGFDTSMYKIVTKNTFAYNPARINVGSYGYSGDLDNIIISSLYVCFQTLDALDDRYLLQYLGTYNFNKSVLRNVEGGVRDYLFYENFSNIKIPLPSLAEQQKISTFLEKIDELIGKIKEQVEVSQNFKNGLLQKMFV
ncbi:MAG: restriction endonuclease subunit S [Cyclobacteriaceae bacterium]